MLRPVSYLEEIKFLFTFSDFFFFTCLFAFKTDSDSNAQEDNEKQMKEERDEMEEQRLQALRDAETNAKLEDEEERRKLDRQKCEREEKERKQKEQERFLKLKSELMNYDFHKCPRIKKESFRDLEVDDIDLVRIALIGPTGSGKSTFVGKNRFFFLPFTSQIKFPLCSLTNCENHIHLIIGFISCI